MPAVVVTSLAYAWLRSRSFTTVIVACVVVAVAGALAADATLRLPFLRRSLPLPALVAFLPALVVTTPLYNRFGSLEATLPRATVDRALAGTVACGLAIAACLPASVAAGARFPWTVLLALLSVALLAVIVLGPLAWLPTLVLGFIAMYVDFVYREPIRSALDTVGTPTLAFAVVACIGGFVVYGPHTS